MPLDCSNVPSNISYNCETPWGKDCTSAKRFEFVSLWSYTQSIQEACANDTRLFLSKGEPATRQNTGLNQAACVAIAGSGWQKYPAVDIWTRLTTWKFPLVQLIAAFPRPPLSLGVELFVIFHLLGDPIDTIKSLLLKLSNCQYWVHHWVKRDRDNERDSERQWKALALLADAYGEWGEETEASDILGEFIGVFQEDPIEKRNLEAAVYWTADALAADRATKFLPIIIALFIFIGAIGIAVGRTASAGAFSETTFIKVEAHGIANSALYFWIIPAVFLSSIIGVSQTQAAIPRILKQLQKDLHLLSLPRQERIEPFNERRGMLNKRLSILNKRLDVLNERLDALNERLDTDDMRKFYGGIYSWQPARWRGRRCAQDSIYIVPGVWFRCKPQDQGPSPAEHHEILFTSGKWNGSALFAYSSVIVGTITGMIISSFVPPEGPSCRHIGQLSTCMAWIVSAGLDTWFDYFVPLKFQTRTRLFCLTFAKDILVTIATVGWVIVIHIGYLNRCVCYTMGGRVALALPEMPQIANKLSHRISTTYPGVAFASIFLELIVIPLIISFRYRHALRVFIQRDDNTSNVEWLRKLSRRFPNMRWPLRLRRDENMIDDAEERGPDNFELQAVPNRANEIVRRRLVGAQRVRTV